MADAPSHPRKHHRVIIVGAGPGGLQLGYFLGRAGIDYVVLERASAAGSFFERFPVHRRLLSINKINTGVSDPEKNLRWDWNSLISDDPDLRLGRYDQAFFPNADSLVKYFRDFCEKKQIRVRFDSEVAKIAKQNGRFLLQTSVGEELTCELLVIATGTPVAHTPDIDGAELAERYGSHDRSIESCINKDILILGKGNSAFETAEELLPYAAHIHLISPGILKMAWQSHFPGNLRQINSPFLETFLLKQQNAVLNGTINTIERVGNKFAASITWTENGHPARFEYDRVILCTGFKFDALPFSEDLKPEVVHAGRLPALTCHWESVNVAGLYFCGALMQANDYKKSASSFVHGMRYNARTLSHLIEARLGVRPYPTTRLPADTDALFDRIYERIRQTSSLWHMHGTLCDAYVYDEQGAAFVELRSVPVRMMAEDPSFMSQPRIEFRFTFENPQDPEERPNFTPVGLLHPAIYFFMAGKQVGECHMYEDVYAEWAQRDQVERRFRPVIARYIGAFGGGPRISHFSSNLTVDIDSPSTVS